MVRKMVAVMSLACTLMWCAAAWATSEPLKVLEELMVGNARFAAGQPLENLAAKSTPAERDIVALGQAPKTIILDCADSRLPPEIIFDKGLGEVFVIRIAGNVIAPHQIASIEYAIEHLKTPRILMILGHERCGAVSSAFDVTDKDGNVNPAGLTESLINLLSTKSLNEAVKTVKKPETGTNSKIDCALVNVKNVYKELAGETGNEVVKHAVHLGELAVVEAFYDLDDGKVTVTAINGVETHTPAASIHTITASAGPHGKIAPAGDSAVADGARQPYFIIPESGYFTSKISIQPTKTGVGHCYWEAYENDRALFSVTGGNCTLTAEFAPFTIKPDAPVLISPADRDVFEATSGTVPVTYSWKPDNKAASYILFTVINGKVTQNTYTAAEANCPTGTGTCSITSTIPSNRPGADVSWRVKGSNAVGASDWSNVNNFSIKIKE